MFESRSHSLFFLFGNHRPVYWFIIDVTDTQAAEWINKMNGSEHDEVLEVEPEARPERLGLGAKVPRQSKVGLSNDPVARKLSSKWGAGKRKASKNKNSTTPSCKDLVEEDDGDEDLDSRSSAFSRKRAGPPTSQLQVKKKLK
ncbi:Detected protein of unknown function [Hibiscus syriacus]|uniref:Uncharacterized protein n=1 Tax=Hibiscus syriacus TaxID=106335 RepID=A0A6A3D0F9_HIBSY|nr:Detected protein of unknown function [Hibiscus syriacus]